MDKTNILEQLFEKDYAVKDIELLPGKLTVQVRNMGFTEQAELEDKLKQLNEQDLNSRQFLQAYTLHHLSFTVVRWGKTRHTTSDQWSSFLSTKSTAVLDKVMQEQQKFEKEVREAVNVEDIKKPSSPGAKPQKDSKPSQEESESEEQAASGNP